MNEKTKNTLKGSLCLVLTALIFGVAFVTQKIGGEYLGAYSINCLRSFLGVLVLLPVIYLPIRPRSTVKVPRSETEKKTLAKAGILCGVVLFLACNLQQLGLNFGTSAGKGGFLTACYIILVPVLGLFFGKKCAWHLWLCVLAALVGLYFLCVEGTFSFALSDLLVLLCSVCFALQILVIDRYVAVVDPVRLTALQFFVCGALSLVLMFVLEVLPNATAWISAFSHWEVWVAILFSGILSSGLAYTLQTVGQLKVPPTLASLLLSLESLFSVLAGVLFLGESLTFTEMIGCIVLFSAVLLAQLPLENVFADKK